jgi:hypothetical protein
MNAEVLRVREVDYELSDKYMGEWLRIECQQVYEKMVMNIVPTGILEDGYAQNAKKYMREWL